MLISFWRFCFNCLNSIPTSRGNGLKICLLRLGGTRVGNNVRVCSGVRVQGRGRLVLGSGVWISPDVIIRTSSEGSIEIGSYCDIGPSVELISGTHLVGNSDRRAGDDLGLSISIGNGTWLGARVIIIGGVSIGFGCVVGAGSVVTRDLISNCLAAGVPAKVKKIYE